MVQNHHVVHSNKRKRNVLSRSKLLIQVSTLRENNKLLAKAVAEKALRICELENTGLSFANLKLESRESIKSFRDYVLNLEALVKKAVTELAGLVNRFSGILTKTKQEKEKVEYLNSLIENENYPPTSIELYNLRGRTVVTEETNPKCMELKEHRSTPRRVHPMNLKKSVCILETVNEQVDLLNTNLPAEGGYNAENKQTRPTNTVKNEEKKIKTDICRRQNVGDSSVRKPNSVNSPSVGDDLKELTKKACQITVKQEAPSPEIKSKIYHADLSGHYKYEDNIQECPRNTKVDLNPRNLRSRKMVTHSEQTHSQIEENYGKYDNIYAKTVENDIEDVENKVKPQLKNVRGKLVYKRRQRNPLSEHQGKADSSENSIQKKELPTKSSDKDAKIDHLHPVTTYNSRRSTTNKNGSSIKSSKQSIDAFHSIKPVTQESMKMIVSAFTSQSESKVLSRSRCFENLSERNTGCQRVPYLLSQITSDEQLITIKREPISPKTTSTADG